MAYTIIRAESAWSANGQPFVRVKFQKRQTEKQTDQSFFSSFAVSRRDNVWSAGATTDNPLHTTPFRMILLKLIAWRQVKPCVYRLEVLRPVVRIARPSVLLKSTPTVWRYAYPELSRLHPMLSRSHSLLLFSSSSTNTTRRCLSANISAHDSVVRLHPLHASDRIWHHRIDHDVIHVANIYRSTATSNCVMLAGFSDLLKSPRDVGDSLLPCGNFNLRDAIFVSIGINFTNLLEEFRVKQHVTWRTLHDIVYCEVMHHRHTDRPKLRFITECHYNLTVQWLHIQSHNK